MIPEVLNLQTFKDEFTHTILHGQNVMKDLKLAAKREDKKGVLEEKMEEMKENDYTPTGITKSQFDSVFNVYLEHLNNAHGKPGESKNGWNKLMTTIAEKEDGSEDEKDEKVD